MPSELTRRACYYRPQFLQLAWQLVLEYCIRACLTNKHQSVHIRDMSRFIRQATDNSTETQHNRITNRVFRASATFSCAESRSRHQCSAGVVHVASVHAAAMAKRCSTGRASISHKFLRHVLWHERLDLAAGLVPTAAADSSPRATPRRDPVACPLGITPPFSDELSAATH